MKEWTSDDPDNDDQQREYKSDRCSGRFGGLM
jgi:hypothetical protein